MVFSPLGTTLGELRWAPGWASLEQGGQRTDSASLQALLQTLVGVGLPVQALFDWLQGQPTQVPGWNVDLDHFAQGRIAARRDTPLPEVLVRIVLQTD